MAPAVLYGKGGDQLLGITWAWAGIGTILFVLRASTAAREPSKMRPSFYGIRYDFIWAVLTYITALIAQIATTISYEKASADGPVLELIPSVIFTGVIANLSAIFCVTFGRFAVIALLLMLQGTAYVHWKKVLLAVGIVQFLANMVQIGFTIHQCDPVHKLWDLQAPGTCQHLALNRRFGFFSGSVGAFSDFFLALYPAVLIIGSLVQMKLSMRIAICFILGGGSVAGVAGIIKTVYLSDIQTVATGYGTIVTWILTEAWFILIFGTLTTVKPVFVAMGGHLKRWSGRLTGTTPRSGYLEQRSWATEQVQGSRSNTNVQDPRSPISPGTWTIDHQVALNTVSSPSKCHYTYDEVELYRQSSWTETHRPHS